MSPHGTTQQAEGHIADDVIAATLRFFDSFFAIFSF